MMVKVKKRKVQTFVTKRKRGFENYKNCLEETELENKITYLEKSKINIDSLKKIIKNS